ncbi:MAG: PEP-CTERM sorting domain-containing protein [Pseudomonadota bacterium]
MNTRSLIAAMMLAVSSANSQAGLLFQGTFSATFVNPSQNQTTFDGNFSATFDDSVLAPNFSGEIRDLTFDSFNVTSGPVGTTMFDTSNTRFNLSYNAFGRLTTFELGGILDTQQPHPSGTLSTSSDDFLMAINVPTGFWLMSWYSAGSATGFDFFRPNGTFTTTSITIDPPSSVPVPGTLALLVSGAFLLRMRRRRKSRQRFGCC